MKIPMKNKSVKMPELLISKIERLCTQEGVKFSTMARILIEKQIKSTKIPKPKDK